MDRVKENLFNILGQDVIGSRWLDLFAGTGAVGIEALSRGAAQAIFCDNVMPAIRAIKENLRHTQLEQQAKVIKTDSFAYLRRHSFAPFDIIYVAPPQYLGLWQKTLQIIDESPAACLAASGMVIVQIDPKEFAALPWRSLHLVDERRYGSTQLCFYQRVAEDVDG